MLNVKKHKWLVVLIGAFVLAWGVWTFVMLPASEVPSSPDPVNPTVNP